MLMSHWPEWDLLQALRRGRPRKHRGARGGCDAARRSRHKGIPARRAWRQCLRPGSPTHPETSAAEGSVRAGRDRAERGCGGREPVALSDDGNCSWRRHSRRGNDEAVDHRGHTNRRLHPLQRIALLRARHPRSRRRHRQGSGAGLPAGDDRTGRARAAAGRTRAPAHGRLRRPHEPDHGRPPGSAPCCVPQGAS